MLNATVSVVPVRKCRTIIAHIVVGEPSRVGDLRKRRRRKAEQQHCKYQLLHTFTWLRRNSQLKTVIFIDQFEQWLFTHSDLEKQSLTLALRQCDGVNLQCVVMVRDDFWMGLTRLMQSLDFTIAEHQNAMVVDLFDTRHAKNVLAMFGAAYGRLNISPEKISVAEHRFLVVFIPT